MTRRFQAWVGVVLWICAAGVAAQEPLLVLQGSRSRRIGGDVDSTSPPHVIPSGRESLEWELPADFERRPYRLDMTVRTGNTGGNPLNCVHLYRAWAVDQAGQACEPVHFRQKPGSTPRNVSDQWPQFIGDIISQAPIVLGAGMRLRVTAAASFAEVRSVRILPAVERDLISLDLTTDQPRHLFHPGQSMHVVWRVKSFLDVPQSLSATLILESPYGDVLTRRSLACEVSADGEALTPVQLQSSLSGPHVASLTCEWRGHSLRRELNLDVIRVPSASELSADSPFGVHPAGLDSMYQSGFKWVRLWDSGDTWNRHERAAKGAFDFSRTESKVDRFREQGVRVLAVLAYTPTWASSRPEGPHYTGAGAPYPPTSMQDWKDYCREYMTHFRGRIRYYEVWNEPNAGFFKGTVDEYVSLLKAAWEVARDVDPDLRIVGGSGTGDFLTWSEEILARGAGQYMDVLSFHAYTTPQSPEEANLQGRIARLHELCAKHGVPDMPLWNTEAGYWCDRRDGARPTTAAEILAKAPAATRPNWKSGWPYRPITEADAAAYTVRHYYLNVASGVEKLFWYSSVTSNFPLLCRDGSLRYPALAVANAAHRLDGFRFVRRIDFGISRLHLQLWTDGDKVIGLLWHADRGTRDLAGPRAGAVRLIDIWGNAVSPVSDGGDIVLSAGRDPLMIVAPEEFFDDLRLRTNELALPIRDCFVVREVNPERPVKVHTSPPHHGNRDVFGLPDAGDTLGWRLKALKPAYYRLFVELRTGDAGGAYRHLDWYRLTIKRDDRLQDVALAPVEEEQLRAVPLTTAEGGGRAYGFAQGVEPVWLEPGNEVHVALKDGFGFVGQLMLRECADQTRVEELSDLPDDAVSLDGDLSEAVALSPMALDRRRQVVIGVADPFASTDQGDAWKGPDDLSAKMWAAAVGESLYVAVAVADGGGIFPADGGAFNGDCIELFLDVRSDDQVGNAVMGSGVYQIMLRAPAERPNHRCEGRVPAGTEAVAVKGEKGWTAEFLIPIDKRSGSLLGLDLAVDDDDNGNGRKSQIVWHGTSQNYQDPSAYGKFRLP